MKNLAKYPKTLCRRATALLIAFVMIAAGVFGTGVTVDAEGAGNPDSMSFSYAYDVQRSPRYPTQGQKITASDLYHPVLAGGGYGTTNEGSWKLTQKGTYSGIMGTSEDSPNLQVIVSGIASNYTGLTKDNIVIHELTNGGVHIAYGVTLAYDSNNGLAFFLGDSLSGGAGYLLSTGEQQSNSVRIYANLDVTDGTAPATYTITVDNTENGTTTTSISETIAGDVVTIHTSPNAGYAVSNVSVKDSDNGNVECVKSSTDGNNYTFVMPAKGVTVTVTYTEIHVHSSHLTYVPATDSTCTTKGNIAYYECSCGAYFEDETGTKEITDKTSVLKPLASHRGGTATCQAKAQCEVCGAEYGGFAGHDFAETYTKDATGHWYVCKTTGCTEKSSVTPHTPNIENATETEDKVCTDCGYVIEAKLGHVHSLHLTRVSATDSTCTTKGNIAYYECSCGAYFEDETGTKEITDKTSVLKPLASHRGGTATCQAKARCEDCDAEYGEALGHDWAAATCTAPKTCKRAGCGATEGDPLGHTLKKTDAIPATVESAGVKAYWTCKSCGMNYADEAGDTVIGNASDLETWKANASASGGQIERAKAEIIEGTNGKWTQDSKTPLAFRSNASFDKFLRVEVDGAVVDAENYDAKSGSIVVSLHADYLNTLSVGEHTLAIVSRLDSGETKASTTFTVAKKDAGTTVKKDTTNKKTTTKAKTVKTGDNSQMTVWLLMMVIAFAVMVTVFVVNKKQRFYNRHTHKR